MKETTAQSRTRWLSWLLAVLPLSAALGCQSEAPPSADAAGLVLNLESDLTMPKDIDAVSVKVTSDSGETMVEERYTLGPGVGRHLLPYQVRVPWKGSAAHVKAQVIAWKRGVPRMERSADVDVPTQRWGTISLPVNYLCDGTVDGASSSCGEGQTCDQGRCISTAVAKVADYIEDVAAGGGAGISLAELSKDDNCVDVIECMSEGLTVQVDTSTCSFDVPVNASGFVNVALKNAKDGFCGPKGCWLPLLFGSVGGWTTNGSTVFLPPAVCFEDPASARFQVTVSDACQTFWPSLALCGIAAATGGDDADDKDDATASTATATTKAGATIACLGPASRPCPSCGRQTRTCDTKTGTWSKWSSCSGGGECALGEFVLNGCPGGLPQVCGPTCEWIPCCNPATCFGGRCSGGVCCGNGVIEGDETCEGDCTTEDECDDGIPCTRDTYTGSVATCRAKCTHTPIIADGDKCCAPGVGPAADSDCQAKLCGNGVIDVGETCDGDCPTDAATDCDDGIVCTRDTIADLGTCRARCRNTPVRNDTDKCCAPGQTSSDDADCLCGNGAIDPGEFCDGDCPAKSDCNDNNPCTADSLVGTATDCSAHCVNKPIVVEGDNCCAPGQTNATDPDCQAAKEKPGCGNGIIETDLGETCEGAGCPTSCVDMDPRTCVEFVLEGSADKCNARCTKVITRMNGDGCCPPVEAGKPDSDCQPICGNGLLDNKEVCEPKPLSAMTPTCASEEACRNLSPCLTANTGPDQCNTPCVRDANIPDGACEVCGDRVLQASEICEPFAFDAKSKCPADSDCKITYGPCYIANSGDEQCAKPCILDPDAKSCGTEPPPSCGNGKLDTGEKCDPLATTPTERCATDAQCKAQGPCLVANKKSSQCSEPCVAAPSGSCDACGDGQVTGDELCDPKATSAAEKCPTSVAQCPVQACMTATLNTPDALCAAPCVYTPVASCMATEPMTGAADSCGDGKKTGKELCDPKAPGLDACPATDTACDDKDACTTDRIRTAADPCARVCENVPIANCPMPSGQTEPACGDGKVAADEKCDPKAPGAGKCPVSAKDCDDQDACTTDSIEGTACQAACAHEPIVPCGNTGTAGGPATPSCGDGMVNGTEMCDPMATGAGKCPAVPTDCPVSTDACLVAKVEGTGCAAHCTTVTPGPMNGDGCCPPGASNANDSDCAPPKPVCGNGKVEEGEECDGSYKGTGCVSEPCITRVPSCTSSCMNECTETVDQDCMMMMMQ